MHQNTQAVPRDHNLDLLRAIAIAMVLVHHVVGMWPSPWPWLAVAAETGRHGVVLFFVLSGWLIGGIYWRERAETGRVNIVNFWIRRWLRTAPPYFAGMSIAYAAVWFTRAETFDLRYLVFLQNYARVIPFYLISWSLCVEEHFYLALPLLGLVVGRLRANGGAILLGLLSLAPPILRLVDPNAGAGEQFGYAQTATHLVFEGLTLGVMAAFFARFHPLRWEFMRNVAQRLQVPSLLAFVAVPFFDRTTQYYLGQSVVALCCVVWLTAVAGAAPLPFASSKVVHAIAISSYSVYLTHSVAIHLGRKLAMPNGQMIGDLVRLGVWLGLIAMAGGVFFWTVERPCIHFRDWLSRKFTHAQ